MSSSARPSASDIDAHMGAAFTKSSTAMCVLDSDRRVVSVNDSMAKLLGRDPNGLTAMPWDALAHSDDEADQKPRSESRAVEVRLARADGTHVWCRTSTTALSIGSFDFWLVEALDITTEHTLADRAAGAEERIRFTTTAFQEELRRLAIAATTDQGTGLRNRRGFFALAQHELNVAHRLGHPLTLIFFDLDRLKQINDTLGHLEGDRAIADTAHLLSSTFRESDLVARLGGDEFCVLALGPPEGFAQTMRRFDGALDGHNRSAGRPYRLSLSYGVAFFEPADGPATLDELMSEADASMYESKIKRRSA